MLEEHQWKTTNTFTKLGGKVGDLGGKVLQLSQAVKETRGRMDKTLEAVQVALREITGIKDQMATWLFQEEVKGIQDSQRTPMSKGSPTDSFRRDLSHGEYEDSGRSSDRRPRRDNTRMAIPQGPEAGRLTRRDYGEDFAHESTGVDRTAGTTGRGRSRIRASPDDREGDRTHRRGGAWDRSSSSESDYSQRRGRWNGHPSKHLPNLELYSGRKTMERFLRSILSPLDDERMVPPGSIDIP